MAATVVNSERELSHRQVLYILSGLLLGLFLSVLDQSVISTSIRTIANDFHGYTLQAWVTTAYLATSTITTPLYGKLSDLYGRKPFFMFAIAVFVLGSLLCSFSTSMYQLAAFRAVQGIGAGGLASLTLTILGDLVAPRQRARYQGYFLAVYTGASLFGPVVGGLLAGTGSIAGVTGWRWVFLVNVPLGLVSLLVVWRVLTLPSVRRADVRIDWLGGSLLTVGLVPLLVVADQGRTWGWGAPDSVLCYCLGFGGLLVFVLVEKAMGEHAFIPLRIFANVRFSQGLALAVVLGATQLGVITLLPQYFQVVLGLTPTRAGLMILPTVLGTVIGAMVSAQIISRTGTYRTHTIVGAVVFVTGVFMLQFLPTDSALPKASVLTLIVGLGLGAFNQPLNLVMQNILPAGDMGVATAAVTFFRQIGSTMGVALFLTLLFSFAAPDIAAELRVAGGQQAQDVGTFVEDTSVLDRLPAATAGPIRHGFADSMDTVFLCMSVLALVGLVLQLCWKPVSLGARTGRQESSTG
ncbi:MDR family MFS transporter [Kitasatospora sp. NPDC086801]|uniref:MDR family MFS transporter n=1 Tax=Kitasatospora sp. NPDC086801 TaxID=3364066 RepID=UPI0037FA3F53